MEIIYTSKSNEKIKRIASLKEKKFRREFGEFIVEGVKQVRECLASPLNVKQIVFSTSFDINEIEVKDIELLNVSDELFAYLSDEKKPQGIMAVVEIPKKPLQTLKTNGILLDRINDPGNLGTIIRTANACGITELYLIDSVDPFSPKCVRSAMSGLFFVNIYQGSNEVLNYLKEVDLICADMNGESVFNFSPKREFCLVIGNEANGVSTQIRESANYIVSIPMRAEAESLNAGVSAGILMYNLKYKNNI